jgi:hypothetical protein
VGGVFLELVLQFVEVFLKLMLRVLR